MSVHVLSVVGARPQFIKAWPVSLALARAGVRETLLHTGQHYDANMSDVFFRELGLREPDIHLGVGSGSHAVQTAAMLTGMEQALDARTPDWVLVYGDTNSTLAGALAASKLHLPIAHVEAGLRSFNRRMPEEVNRVVVDHLSQVLFAPTETACENLRREGIGADRIQNVGDVMLDAVRLCRDRAGRDSDCLKDLGLKHGQYVLATIHRAENTDDPTTLRNIVAGLAIAARKWTVVLPLHPRTRKALTEIGNVDLTALRCIEPVGFVRMQCLEASARAVVTDSGGVQKEAAWHGVPCVTLRRQTEWVELVEQGGNLLCPPESPEQISAAILEAATRTVPVGLLDGAEPAADRIVRLLAGGCPG